MFPQVRQKTWVIRPVRLPPFVGQVNHWQPASGGCGDLLVYGGEVNSRGQHHAKSRSSREIGRYRRSQSSRRGLRIGLIVALVVVVGSTAWFASRVLMVKAELEASQALIGEMVTQGTAFDLPALASSTEELEARSSHALSGTHDVTWRIAEIIPVFGQNLTAVRIVAESVDSIVQEVAGPAVSAVTSLDLSNRDPVTGGFDLSPVAKLQKVVANAESVLSEAHDDVSSALDLNTIDQVHEAVVKIDRLLAEATPVASSASPIVDAAADAIGLNGPRNYLLAFQNNAESTALGGSAASYTVLTVDNGAISIAAQAGGSNDLVDGLAVDVNVDQSAIDLYSEYLISYPNSSTSRPDFPTAAQIMSAFWQRDKGLAVDGVVSIDPLALAKVLNATGPVTLASGDILTADNAVSLLVNEIYFRYGRYDQYEIVDAFFQGAAASILGAVTSGDFDVNAMVTAVTEGIDQGSIMMWSANPDEQKLLDGTRIQGALPKSNDESTVLGTYYRDTSGSKIDYYLETSTDTTTDVCTAPENPSFTTTVTLHSNLTTEQADALPDYVKSQQFGSERFATQVFVYGPVGASVTDAQVVSEGYASSVSSTNIVDLGRPVSSFMVFLAPGETSVVTATFAGAPGTYGPVEVRGTPMINATARTLTPATCG
jgi:hypothetical protein